MSEPTVEQQRALRELPGVDAALKEAGVRAAAEGLPQALQTRVVREALESMRREIRNGAGADGVGGPGALVHGAGAHGASEDTPSAVESTERKEARESAKPRESTVETPGAIRTEALRRCEAALRELRLPHVVAAINATGVIVHTGMGRSPLADEALTAVAEVSRGYSDVAISRETGGRRKRSSGVEALLRALTGCEAALVTNNNAAATMLALNTFAKSREAIVSRGQLVEIGGSFRLPEVMEAAGVRLREVGTTNRTRLADYEAAIGEETGAIVRIHPSNYRVVGFTESVGTAELAALARSRGIAMLDDIGSGAMVDFGQWGLKGETTVRESVEAGADVTLFSGDKLLGGPQAGVLVGRREAIEACARNPLMRALRVDKMTVAALEATLRLYLEPERLAERLPLMRAIAEDAGAVKARAERLAGELKRLAAGVTAEVVEDVAYVGGGSLPDQTLASAAVTIEVGEYRVEALKRALRRGEPVVFARGREGRLEFDLRTVAEGEVEALARAIAGALREGLKCGES